jgi:glucosyl-3-phosphoglycerate synthase
VSDFHQTGVVSTLHRFPASRLEPLETELESIAATRPITLVLPTLCSEFHRPALERIVAELGNVRYLHQIVVSLSDGDRAAYEHARRFFSVLPHRVRIIWNAGAEVARLYDLLDQHDLRIGPNGKGRAVWIALGYVLAEGRSHMVALHDCDVVNYRRELLARLCYPVANPDLGYEFCKGYYSRVNHRLYGRVTRLFVTPLIRALEEAFGHEPMLLYLDSFRYPLAGEIAMTAELARANKMHGNWGMDLGLLAEVFNNVSTQRICQVGLMDTYEHKHQPLSEGDPEKGLFRMSIDITKVLFRTLAARGVVFSDRLIETLLMTYLATAQDTVRKYHHDALINNLSFDRSQEDLAVKTFARGLRIGGSAFLENPLDPPEIPSWNRVISALPDFPSLLRDAVESDESRLELA